MNGGRRGPLAARPTGSHLVPLPRLLVSLVLAAALLPVAGIGSAAAQTPADSAWEAGDMDRARELYAQRLAADSSDVTALHRLALIHAWDEEYDLSLALFDRLLEIAPSYTDARIDRARVVAWTGDYDRALELLDRVAGRAPDEPAVRYERARILGWAGRFGDAAAVYRALLDRDPDDVDALVGLARVLRWQGRHDAAVDPIDRALQLDPNRAAAREEQRLLRAQLGPRVAPGFTYEWDSDGNDIYTIFAHAAVRPTPGLELRVDGYRRGASLDPVAPETRWTTGGALTARLELPPGWTLAGSVGGGVPDLAGVDATATWTLVTASPARYPLRGTLTVGRELFDATAVLLASRVVYDRVRVDLGAAPGRWTLEGHASVAWFESMETSTGNRRLAGSIRAIRPLAPWFDLGARARAFGFDERLAQGYFDPDLYALLDVPATASSPLGPLTARLTVAPGVQWIGTGGDPTVAYSTTGALEWGPAPGRTVSLELVYAENGTGPLAQDATDYRYFAASLRARWVF